MKLAYEAVIFDLDGIITQTAAIHFKAWKKVFDEFLESSSKTNDRSYSEFTQEDYLKYVDGKPRYEGVMAFLESRNIKLPQGNEADGFSDHTIFGVGNQKNEYFLEILKQEGAEVYESTRLLLFELKEAEVKQGVASSSKNCKAVLESVGLLPMFEALVDGLVTAELNLNGKPAPDIFIKACEFMNVRPENAIVIEDAVSGVRAGSDGNFGLTLGVARKDNETQLLNNGADYVVTDLNQLKGVNGLNEIFLKYRRQNN